MTTTARATLAALLLALGGFGCSQAPARRESPAITLRVEFEAKEVSALLAAGGPPDLAAKAAVEVRWPGREAARK